MAVTINGDGLIQVDGTTSTQGRVRLAEDADNGTNYIELTAPAAVAADRIITFPDATTTVVGTDTTQTLTNKTINASQLVAASVTSTQLATAVQPIGVGQTWQNVASSRALGSTYTNSTGRPIMVSVTVNNNNSASQSAVTFAVDSVTVARLTPAESNGVSWGGVNLATTFIVPAGSTYSATQTTGASVIVFWAELR